MIPNRYGQYKYQLVDKEGHVIENFINLNVCREFKRKMEKITGEEYEIEYM